MLEAASPARSYLMEESSLPIIFQRSRMDWYDGLIGHHVLYVQGGERGVQAAEIGEILKHRPDDTIGQLVWLITRCNEYG